LADQDFAIPEATRLEQLRLDAAEARLEALLELGANAEVVADAQHMVATHGLRERLWELLILALYRSGRQADALATYQRARTLLVEQLGVEPRPPLRELERRILAQDPTLDQPTRAAHETTSTQRTPTKPRVRSRLPVPLTSFIGRVDERAELAAALKQHRLVTAVGPGGLARRVLLSRSPRTLATNSTTVSFSSI
jgi:hypothetical protein